MEKLYQCEDKLFETEVSGFLEVYFNGGVLPAAEANLSRQPVSGVCVSERPIKR